MNRWLGLGGLEMAPGDNTSQTLATLLPRGR